jgi:hypothetical protein
VLFHTDPAVDIPGASEDLIGVDGLARIAAERHGDEPESFLPSVEAELLRLNAGRHEGWWLLALDLRPAASAPPPEENVARERPANPIQQ